VVCSGLEFGRRVGIDLAAYCDYLEIGCRPIHFMPPLLDSESRLRDRSFGTGLAGTVAWLADLRSGAFQTVHQLSGGTAAWIPRPPQLLHSR
jgi:hypothetical protein